MARLLRWLLALLKVPPEPQPPFGSAASLRVFRAGRNYYRLRLASWTVAQVIALGALLFWSAILIGVEQEVFARDEAPVVDPAGAAETNPPAPAMDAAPVEPQRSKNVIERFVEYVTSIANKVAPPGQTRPTGIRDWIVGYKEFFVELALNLPDWAFSLIWAVKLASFAIYLAQLPITYAMRRLDYEMRWYMVTDRSLRLRHGIWKVVESTMSFANLQQVVIAQGPIQRLFGLADVKVQSAGGGSGPRKDRQSDHDDMHVGLFRHVTNATEIRDLILERLRRFRDAGLGDPEERSRATAMPRDASVAQSPSDAIGAAHELLAEARALRAVIRPG